MVVWFLDCQSLKFVKFRCFYSIKIISCAVSFIKVSLHHRTSYLQITTWNNRIDSISQCGYHWVLKNPAWPRTFNQQFQITFHATVEEYLTSDIQIIACLRGNQGQDISCETLPGQPSGIDAQRNCGPTPTPTTSTSTTITNVPPSTTTTTNPPTSTTSTTTKTTTTNPPTSTASSTTNPPTTNPTLTQHHWVDAPTETVYEITFKVPLVTKLEGNWWIALTLSKKVNHVSMLIVS